MPKEILDPRERDREIEDSLEEEDEQRLIDAEYMAEYNYEYSRSLRRYDI